MQHYELWVQTTFIGWTLDLVENPQRSIVGHAYRRVCSWHRIIPAHICAQPMPVYEGVISLFDMTRTSDAPEFFDNKTLNLTNWNYTLKNTQ